jgi:hypothetical protein
MYSHFRPMPLLHDPVFRWQLGGYGVAKNINLTDNKLDFHALICCAFSTATVESDALRIVTMQRQRFESLSPHIQLAIYLSQIKT